MKLLLPFINSTVIKMKFQKKKGNKKIFYNFFIFFSILVIFVSNSFFSYHDHFLNDFLFAEHANNLSKTKNFFEVLPNFSNLFGIPIWIIEPKLNFLKELNYNLSSETDYFTYLIAFRLLELLVLLFFLKTFTKKILIQDILIILFLYVILLVNFSRYDFESYMNLPILIFFLFTLLSFNTKNYYYFFTFNFIGNFWSYFLNPIYFFNTCFFPLIFFYSLLLYEKKYKNLFLIFLANVPFSILFILLTLGSSRFALPDLFVSSEPHRNFSIILSKNFILISSIFFLISIFNYFKKRNFYSFFFIFFTISTVLIGIIYKVNLDNWTLTPPYQIEYAAQYFLIFIFYKLLKKTDKNILSMVMIFFFTLFLYRSYFFFDKFLDLSIYENKKIMIDKKNIYKRKFFWSKYNEFFLKGDLKFKRTYLHLPNKDTDYYKSLTFYDLDGNKKLANPASTFNQNFNGSLTYPFFWNNNIVTNTGYSHMLDINSVLSNLNSNAKIERHNVPNFGLTEAFFKFYQIEYILSDKTLDSSTIKNYKLIKQYKFSTYELFLHKMIDDQVSNISSIKKIKEIKSITNKQNYINDINQFNDTLYIYKKDKKKISSINYFCNLKIVHTKNSILFKLKNNNREKCLAILPVPFSNNNRFLDESRKECVTFEAQYYFHGCVVNKDTTLELKKKNVLLYSIASVKDYLNKK